MAPNVTSTPYNQRRNITFGRYNVRDSFSRDYDDTKFHYNNSNNRFCGHRDMSSASRDFSVYRESGLDNIRNDNRETRHESGLYQRIEALEGEIESLKVELYRIRNQNCGDWSKQHQIDIALPIFSGDLSEDPIEFIQELEQYMIYRRIPSEYQTKTLQNALRGNARIWFDAVRHDLDNFGQFCDAFRNEFLSVDT